MVRRVRAAYLGSTRRLSAGRLRRGGAPTELLHGIRNGQSPDLGFHVNDWVAPTRDPLLERGMMGDGVVELRRIRAAVEAAGYGGPIEVEIFNPAIWDRRGDEVLATTKRRYAAHV